MIASVLLFLAVLGGPVDRTTDISVTIPNIKEVKGEIVIAIYDQTEKFPKVGETYRTVRFKVRSATETYTIKNVKQGECALAIYHDENSDGICNSNFFGIPKEGYGFSNNIKPVFRAPPYEACMIRIPENSSISVKLIY
ncbi:MAG: DUF2141 domain-containing protein [Saprospirales bacterium]|nr:DUF2141 domain-containing protein [Saprospirales bacterium]